MMILKKIAHKVAQAFRLAQAADKKLSTGRHSSSAGR